MIDCFFIAGEGNLGPSVKNGVEGQSGPSLQGCLAHKKTPTPLDPTVGRCLGPYGGPRGVGVSYERGTPERTAIKPHRYRFRAKREQLERMSGLLPESQGQILIYAIFARQREGRMACRAVKAPTSRLIFLGGV